METAGKENRINIAEAKKHFSELVGKVAYGNEEIVVTKRGAPMAKIIPFHEKKRHPAHIKGWLSAADRFFQDIASFRKYRPRVLKTNVFA